MGITETKAKKMRRAQKAREKWLPSEFRSGFLELMDKRTDLYARLNGAFRRIVEDCGGVEVMPYTKVALVERFVWLEENLRALEMKLLKDPQKEDFGRWCQGVNSMVGLSRILGLANPLKADDIFDAQLYNDDPDPEPERKKKR